MTHERSLAPVEPIEKFILEVRGRKIVLDADLARIYGVTQSA